ncbi:Protein of unknown function [Filimonas lacunae]|uniref:DUF4242 domain-containing protein n=1 Tax=Filimonas lacunae TaxID=477680 RepID=A0A173M973_9BACT|nr:DUF4242 domain-containing protein [Filimonas lacunae]BAV04070.1 hypothetical protein FLA_0049 [Filimonas lacunae]SIT15773.1 Protein of unknown function [Filimonas lacunae]
MKKFIHYNVLSLVFLLLFTIAGKAQTTTTSSTTQKQPVMKMYVIEREIPGIGQFTPAQLKGASQTSCKVLNEIGPKIEWIQSYVTCNKLYCIYKAENEELIREHAKKGGFPANSISEVSGIISPATATGN